MNLPRDAMCERKWRRQFFVASAFVFVAALSYFTSDPADDDLVRAMAKATLLLLSGWFACFLFVSLAKPMVATGADGSVAGDRQ